MIAILHDLIVHEQLGIILVWYILGDAGCISSVVCFMLAKYLWALRKELKSPGIPSFGRKGR